MDAPKDCQWSGYGDAVAGGSKGAAWLRRGDRARSANAEDAEEVVRGHKIPDWDT
ncbi:MAG: hypothetical protein AAF585_17140 [Verrucomicrobiota bacterium]